MLPYHKTIGIILKSRNYSEADKLLTVYTRSFGKINAIAKGARKIKSRFGSSLESFTESKFLMFKNEHKELYLITQSETENSFFNILRTIKKFSVSSAVTEFFYVFTPFSEKNIPLYNLLHFVLRLISYANYEEKILLMFMVKFLSLGGYKIHLSSCSACGRGIKMYPALKIKLSPKYGGIICESCVHKDRQSIAVLNSTIKLLDYLQKKNFKLLSNIIINDTLSEEIKNTVIRFLEYHFEGKLKSLRVMENLRNYGS